MIARSYCYEWSYNRTGRGIIDSQGRHACLRLGQARPKMKGRLQAGAWWGTMETVRQPAVGVPSWS